MVELSRAIVSVRSIPGVSVTQVPSRVRGVGDAGDRLSADAAVRGHRGPAAWPWKRLEFGCVLYETLTGVAAFGGGETVSEIIGRILEREPDWTRLPPSTPLNVRALVRRCLEKDPKRRLRYIGDARAALEEPVGHEVPPGQRPAGRILIGAALGVGIVLGAVGAWSIFRARAEAPLVTRTNRELDLLPVSSEFT